MILAAGGGTGFAIGLVTAISTGIPLLAQLIFAGYLYVETNEETVFASRHLFESRRPLLHWLSLAFAYQGHRAPCAPFSVISIFSFGGVFAGISYTHLLGQSILKQDRRGFMAYRQIAGSALSLLGEALCAKVHSWKRELSGQLSADVLHRRKFAVVASLGFTKVRERRITELKFWILKIMKSIPKTLKKDANLLNYIVFNNLYRFRIGPDPVLCSLGEGQFGLKWKDVGSFSMLQMIGMLGSRCSVESFS